MTDQATAERGWSVEAAMIPPRPPRALPDYLAAPRQHGEWPFGAPLKLPAVPAELLAGAEFTDTEAVVHDVLVERIRAELQAAYGMPQPLLDAWRQLKEER